MGLLCSRSKADKQVNPAPCCEEEPVPQATSSSSKAANASQVATSKEISATTPDLDTQGDRKPKAVAEPETELDVARKLAAQTTSSQCMEDLPPAVEEQRVKNISSQSAEDVPPAVEEQRVQTVPQSAEDVSPVVEEQRVENVSSQSAEDVPPVVEEQRVQTASQSAEDVPPAVEAQRENYKEMPELPASSLDTRTPEVSNLGNVTLPNSAPLALESPEVEGLSPSSSAAVQEEEEVRIEPVCSSVERVASEDQTTWLLEAVENDDWAIVEDLLSGAGEFDPNARTNDWGYSVLRAAAEEGAVEVCRLLIARKADVNARDPNGMTPLMGCVTGGDVGEIVTMLLEAKADATATTDDNFTALKWATRLNHEASISLLRAAGLQGETSCF